MSHLITIPFTTSLDQLFNLATDQTIAYGGKLTGSKWKGSFLVSALGGKFEGDYEVKNNLIFFNIVQKPLFIPYSLIESFLKMHIK